ncbi:hypothetical protein [Actinocrinis puniceicyclus]|uniref:hypothetical protein n=1 Tax=Actinocrinis puniceicyclus TaxID=977794 RepID=UPI001B8C65D7|nr:hypothetical protein [Actinocrinis puniceicyclus]
MLLQETPGTSDGGRIYKVDFLVRDLARPFLHPGAKMLVTEGPKVVASAVIREVRPENSAG